MFSANNKMKRIRSNLAMANACNSALSLAKENVSPLRIYEQTKNKKQKYLISSRTK